MIDSGDTDEKDFRTIKKAIRGKEIEYIIITHSHLDHIANARKIKELTNAKIIISSYENDFLKNGTESESYPLRKHNKLIFGFLNNYVFEFNETPEIGVRGDVIFSVEDEKLEDEEVERELLSEYDIELVYTPGHTKGSISIFRNGVNDIFVGDLIGAHVLTFGGGRRGWGYFFYLQDFETAKKSYQKVADLKPSRIYSSHIHGYITNEMLVKKFGLKQYL